MRVSISLSMCVLTSEREHSIIQLKIRAHDDLPSVAVVQKFSWRNVKTVGDNFSDSLSRRWRSFLCMVFGISESAGQWSEKSRECTEKIMVDLFVEKSMSNACYIIKSRT